VVRASYGIADEGMSVEYLCSKHETRNDDPVACFRLRPVNPIRVVRSSGGRTEYTEEYRPATKGEAWATLISMEDGDRSTNVLSNCLMLGLCPMGMISPDLDKYLELEMVCETYKTPPVDGGVDNWPALTYDAFLAIRAAHEAVKGEKAREMKARRKRATKG